jgi:hypothetical protein
VSAKTYLAGVAGLLRTWADRISPETGPHGIHWSFTYEDREGIRFRDDGKGCPLWYLGADDYERAHTEADTRHIRVNWKAMTFDYPGGSS